MAARDSARRTFRPLFDEPDLKPKPAQSGKGRGIRHGCAAALTLLVCCTLALSLFIFADTQHLLASSRTLSCASLSVSDSALPSAARRADSRPASLNSPSPDGFDVSIGGITLPCSRFFRVAPTACEVTLSSLGSGAPPRVAKIRLAASFLTSCWRSLHGRDCRRERDHSCVVASPASPRRRGCL